MIFQKVVALIRSYSDFRWHPIHLEFVWVCYLPKALKLGRGTSHHSCLFSHGRWSSRHDASVLVSALLRDECQIWNKPAQWKPVTLPATARPGRGSGPTGVTSQMLGSLLLPPIEHCPLPPAHSSQVSMSELQFGHKGCLTAICLTVRVVLADGPENSSWSSSEMIFPNAAFQEGEKMTVVSTSLY